MKLHFLAHRQRFKYMEVMVVPRLLRSSLLIGFFLAVFVAHPLFAQEWFRTGTGLGVEKPRVAVADFCAAGCDNEITLWRVTREGLRKEASLAPPAGARPPHK